jgi:transcriptional regulator with XRE-family HTH domain
MSAGTEHTVSDTADLREHKLTINQLVGYNIAWYRKAAGLTQVELGERLGGWTKVAVSAAERSQVGKRVRKFDADELVTLARALGVPVIALFLPPEDAGTARRYVLDGPGFPELTTLLPDIVPVGDGDSPGMAAYRQRRMALGLRDEEEILAEARSQAGALELDALERHRQAMAPLWQQREELERRVDDLRAFEREYRSRLVAYLEHELRELRTGTYVARVFPVSAAAPSGSTSATRSAARGQLKSGPALQKGTETDKDTAVRVLVLAQMTADQAIADARLEADETLGRARREADEILDKARRQANEIRAKATPGPGA